MNKTWQDRFNNLMENAGSFLPINGYRAFVRNELKNILDEAINIGAYRRSDFGKYKQPVPPQLKGFEEGIVWYQQQLKNLKKEL